MPEVKLGRISLHAAGITVGSAAVFVSALVAAPSAEAHGGVSIGIGFGFPGFIGAPVYAPPVYYAPPSVYYRAPYVAYGHRLYKGIATTTACIMIVSVAAAINQRAR